MLEYHKNSAEILQALTVKLHKKINEASSLPKEEFKPKTLEDLGLERINSVDNLGTLNNNNEERPSASPKLSPAPSSSNLAAMSGTNAKSTSPQTISPTRSVIFVSTKS